MTKIQAILYLCGWFENTPEGGKSPITPSFLQVEQNKWYHLIHRQKYIQTIFRINIVIRRPKTGFDPYQNPCSLNLRFDPPSYSDYRKINSKYIRIVYFDDKNDSVVCFGLSSDLNEIELIYRPSKWLKYTLRGRKLELSHKYVDISK